MCVVMVAVTGRGSTERIDQWQTPAGHSCSSWTAGRSAIVGVRASVLGAFWVGVVLEGSEEMSAVVVTGKRRVVVVVGGGGGVVGVASSATGTQCSCRLAGASSHRSERPFVDYV